MGEKKGLYKKIGLILIALLAVGFGAAYFVLLPSAERTVRNLHIGTVDIGNLTQEEVEARLAEVVKETRDDAVVLELVDNEDKAWSVKAEEIDFAIDAQATAECVMTVGRAGNLWENLLAGYRAMTRTDVVGYVVSYDEKKLQTIVDKISGQIDVKPIEAHAELVDGKVEIRAEQTGYLVNAEAVLADVRAFGSTVPRRTSLHIDTIPATVTTDALDDIKDVLSIYTTQFASAADGRARNIQLSAEALNGLLMKPNDVFSFNDVVGVRSAERGYQAAAVIVNGQMATGLGGGICQVSTTLYNAILLANLGVIERECHFFPSSYVPIGLDATVDYGNIDLKFRNSRQSDIYLWAKVEGNLVTIAVLGNAQKEPVPKIEYYSEVERVIVPETIEHEDPSLPQGESVVIQSGKQGFVSATYRGENGTYLLAYRDSYPATPRVIAVGTKPTEQEQPTEVSTEQASEDMTL